jgi:hypothetical protein
MPGAEVKAAMTRCTVEHNKEKLPVGPTQSLQGTRRYDARQCRPWLKLDSSWRKPHHPSIIILPQNLQIMFEAEKETFYSASLWSLFEPNLKPLID